MKARSIRVNSAEEIGKALAKGKDEGFHPTLAFVFISFKQDLNAVTSVLNQAGIAVFGATTSGEFIDGELGSGSIAILFLDVDPSCFQLLLEDYEGRDSSVVTEEMTRIAKARFERPAFLISCGFDVVQDSVESGEPVLRAIERVAGPDAIVWGGRAGDDFIFQKSIVFTGERSTNAGIVMLVLDSDRILVKGQAVSGQKAVGTEKVITRAVDNWVYEIDHQPAADMVLKYLGLHLTQQEAETFNPANIVFSLSRASGEPVLRGVGVFNWKDRSIAMLGGIREGDRIRLTLPPDFEILEEESSNAAIIKAREIPEPDALVIFNCMGRLGLFGPLTGEEIEGLRKVFDVPMAGFFTYGEFGRADRGHNEFHNNTCCWVALKEI
jgi:hypothetical protein